MLNLLAAGALALAVMQTDQTVPVQRGSRLDVNNFAGEVVVRTWEKDAVRVEASHSDRETVDVRNNGSVVSVRTRSRLGAPRSMDFRVTVPAWMRLDIRGTYLDVTVEGTQGDVVAETVRGDIRVRGGAGFVSLKSVEGMVTLDGARGRISVSSVNEAVRVSETSGEVTAETVNGGITMERMDAASVDAATVNGAVVYTGSLAKDGRYRMSSHNGDVVVTIPGSSNATVTARTYNGTFSSTFPTGEADLKRTRRITFTIGSGSAQLDLESFSGSIRVRRAEGGGPTRD
jgi:DUF4097 and DUF4098 domain-containing protein YvlB